MARILAYTSPARGHLFPLTPILDELSRRGHQIALRTLASEVPRMRARGFDAAPIDERVEAIEHDDWRARNSQAALGRAVRRFLDRAEHDGPDLRQAIADERPDALLVDINSWGGLAAAEAWGGPWATFCPYPLTLSSRDAPPFGPGLPPARGPLGRMRDRALRPLVFGTLAKKVLPPLNGVRTHMGLTPLARCRRHVPAATAAPLHDRGAVRVSTQRLARHRRDGRPVRVGASRRPARMAGPDRAADRAGHDLVRVPGRRPPGNGRARGGLAEEPFDVVVTLPAGDLG